MSCYLLEQLPQVTLFLADHPDELKCIGEYVWACDSRMRHRSAETQRITGRFHIESPTVWSNAVSPSALMGKGLKPLLDNWSIPRQIVPDFRILHPHVLDFDENCSVGYFWLWRRCDNFRTIGTIVFELSRVTVFWFCDLEVTLEGCSS